MCKIMKPVLLLLFIIAALPVFCDEYFVNVSTGSDEEGLVSIEKPFKTISYALSQVDGTKNNPAFIHVSEGTYNIESGEVFPLTLKRHVNILGENMSTTVLNASGADNTVIYCLQVSNVSIRRFTITGGTGVYLPDD